MHTANQCLTPSLERLVFPKPTPEKLSVPRTEYLILPKLYLEDCLSSSLGGKIVVIFSENVES